MVPRKCIPLRMQQQQQQQHRRLCHITRRLMLPLYCCCCSPLRPPPPPVLPSSRSSPRPHLLSKKTAMYFRKVIGVKLRSIMKITVLQGRAIVHDFFSYLADSQHLGEALSVSQVGLLPILILMLTR